MAKRLMVIQQPDLQPYKKNSNLSVMEKKCFHVAVTEECGLHLFCIYAHLRHKYMRLPEAIPPASTDSFFHITG